MDNFAKQSDKERKDLLQEATIGLFTQNTIFLTQNCCIFLLISSLMKEDALPLFDN